MAMPKGRTITLLKKSTPNAGRWVRWLEENSISSAGPRANLVGLRKSQWGREALIVRSGAYLYLITTNDDGRTMPWDGCE